MHFSGRILSLLLGVVAGCSVVVAGEWQFVRQGLAIDAAFDATVQYSVSRNQVAITSTARPLSHRQTLLEFDWQPLEQYQVHWHGLQRKFRAPLRPAPLLLHKVDLEEVDQAALAGSSPDAVVKFSPNGRYLALGTFGGWLRIIDCHTGQIPHRQRIAEGMVKQLAWSADSRRLYLGEQSPDAQLICLTVEAGPVANALVVKPAWKARLAAQIQSSRPAANDRFGVYSLPCVFDLKPAADERIFAAGVHSWSVDGELRNRSALYSFDSHGSLLWQLPRQGAWPLIVNQFAVDGRGERLLILPSQSQAATGNETLRTDTLYLLDARTAKIADEYRIAPLKPHFSRVYTWDSLAIDTSGNRAAIGLADGRGLVFDTTEHRLTLLKQLDLATPILVGNTPIVASASYTRIFDGMICFQTQNTHIPFGSPQAALEVPALHRAANTLTVTDGQGQVQWRYRGPFAISGNWYAKVLVVACRESPGAKETSQFGFLLFDPQRSGGGSERLVYYYPTVGTVLFNADVSSTGLVAVVEVPAPHSNRRDTYGRHQLHIVY